MFKKIFILLAKFANAIEEANEAAYRSEHPHFYTEEEKDGWIHTIRTDDDGEFVFISSDPNGIFYVDGVRFVGQSK